MNKEIALIFIEGETEEEFYQVICDKYLKKVSKKIFNLHGNFNIHNKVLDKTYSFLDKNPQIRVRVYCCIDRESRDHNPPLDIDHLTTTFKIGSRKCPILSVDKIIATQMIESWFFHDMDGIYKFLSTPKSQRTFHKYKTTERLTHIDLGKLFTRYGKNYIKGKRCRNFINHLDIEKIFADCEELQKGVELILKKGNRK